MRIAKYVARQSLLCLAFAFVLLAPVAAAADENHRTINKSIKLGADTDAGSVQSVNGSIRVGASSVVRSIESVNGSIELREGVKVEKDVKAVNGRIELEAGAAVGGHVETVNGSITLSDTDVAGDVETVNGSIRLLDGTTVEGDVKVEKPWGWSSDRKKPVKVEIGRDVIVNGDLIFEHAVELRIHDSARVGEIRGDEVTVREG